MDHIFTITPPGAFDYEPSSWPAWIKRFERFRVASGLKDKDSAFQVNSLIYTMGEKAEDILSSFDLEAAKVNNYDEVKKAFDEHFVGNTNVIYERAKFNKRCQEVGESAESFITAVHKLAEHCKFGVLREELIRDRIVVGIRDAKLSEKMQLNDKLDLKTAVTQVKQHEEVKKQQAVLRSTEATGQVDAISRRKISGKKPAEGFRPSHQQHTAKPKPCGKCGKFPKHSWKDCPAKDVECRKCSKKGHYAAVCRAAQKLDCIDEDNSVAYLGAVNHSQSSTWTETLAVNGGPVCFKVDTGASVTAIPETEYDEHKHGACTAARWPLLGPSGQPLNVMGQVTAVIQRGDRKIEEEVYIVKDLTTSLLGLPAIRRLHMIPQLNSVDDTEASFRSTYPEVFQGLGQLQGEYKIKLKEDALPYALSAPRRVAIPLRAKVKEELDRMEKLGVIARVEEPTEWCAGMVPIVKPSGKIRICVDLTHLNENVIRERHILPAVDETLAKLEGARFFTKLDATSGFWQVPLHKESMLLTTFITPEGRYYFKRLPFGISSAPEHFQKRISQLTDGIDGVLCHADDVLIIGQDRAEHDSRLHRVLQKFREAGLTLNEKCQFGLTEIRFLGHVINAQGIRADPDKIKAILEMPEPRDVADVRRFMGMVNFVGKFSPRLPDLTKPIRDLLKTENSWTWGPPQQKAFRETKKELGSETVLAQYSPSRETMVSADASSYGLGGVLTQKQPDGEWRPVVFISRSLTKAESRYAQIEKEALALTWACERLRGYLSGLDFTIRTDHKPLLTLLKSRALDDLPPRIIRFRLRLLRFNFNIIHVPGKNLITADALSRAPLPTTGTEGEHNLEKECQAYLNSVVESLPATPTKLEQIKSAQRSDDACKRLSRYIANGWPEHRRDVHELLLPYWQDRSCLHVGGGLLMKGERLIIPEHMRAEILQRLHQGHQGINKCLARARESVWWPGITSAVKQMVERCETCAREAQTPVEPLLTTELPSRPWQRVAADLFQWQNGNYLVLIDYFSRYIEVCTLPSTSAKQTIARFKAVFARHGCPEVLVTDNGPQFSCMEFSQFAQDYDFTHVTSSPRFPRSNGEAERAVRTVKSLLEKEGDFHKALLAYRATPLAHGFSPSQLLMGRRIRTPVPVSPTQLQPEWPDLQTFRTKDAAVKLQQQQTYNRRHRTQTLPPLQPGQQVWVRPTNTRGTVVGPAHTPRSYEVETAEGGQLRRNRSHLREVPVPPEPGETVTTRSGRPSRPPERLNL